MLSGNFYYTVYFIFCYFRKIESLHHYTEKICCAPKRIQKTWVHSPIHHHLNSRRHLKTAPPKRIQKSPYTNPTPPIEQQTHLKKHRARRIQKISVHSPIHTLLDSPPQNESKKYPYTHPYTQPIEHQTTPQAAPCSTVPPKKSDLIFFAPLLLFFWL